MPPVGEHPISHPEFDALMAPLAPFEAKPRLAVAVSGGADSMALVVLADHWAWRRGGDVVGLTVDHGLRPEAAAEARQVGRWLRRRGIRHAVLRWATPRSASGVQAAARAARYDLLAGWCRRRGLLHLLTAHHLDDQAETVLFRVQRQSGFDGLAAMPAARPLPGVRLLRPLLPVPRARLRHTLNAEAQEWIDDPSNDDTAFARVRVRRALAALAGAGVPADGFVELAAMAGAWRARSAGAVAQLAARAVRLDPAGFAMVDGAAWLAAPELVRRPLLAALLATIGGRIYPPGDGGFDRLLAQLERGRGGTLAGCRVLPRRDRLLIAREAGRLPPPIRLRSGDGGRWDRFDVRLDRGVSGSVTVGALGENGWRTIAGEVASPPPVPVRPTLPALWHKGRIIAVPHLAWRLSTGHLQRQQFSAIFAPPHPLTTAGLRVA